MDLRRKRAYDSASAGDGYRVLESVLRGMIG